MRFFQLYQYLAPLILFPLSYWLWLRRSGHDHAVAILLISMPILFAYLIPALGTNWLRLWEFSTRFRIGRFRPHHGFLFGSASSLLALLVLGPGSEHGTAAVLRSAFVLGSVLALWNWIYDLHAIKVGFIRVYTRAYHENRSPEAIATGYAPIFFGAFGACYGVCVRICEHQLVVLGRSERYWPLLLACNLVVCVTPVVVYVLWSLIRTGETGLHSYQEKRHER